MSSSSSSSLLFGWWPLVWPGKASWGRMSTAGSGYFDLLSMSRTWLCLASTLMMLMVPIFCQKLSWVGEDSIFSVVFQSHVDPFSPISNEASFCLMGRWGRSRPYILWAMVAPGAGHKEKRGRGLTLCSPLLLSEVPPTTLTAAPFLGMSPSPCAWSWMPTTNHAFLSGLPFPLSAFTCSQLTSFLWTYLWPCLGM